MEFLLLVVIVVIVVIVVVNGTKSEVRYLGEKINTLVQEIRLLKKEIHSLQGRNDNPVKKDQNPAPVDYSAFTPKPADEPQVQKTEIHVPPIVPEPIPDPTTTIPPVYKEEVLYLRDPKPKMEPVASFHKPIHQSEPALVFINSKGWYEKWLSKNPDLEKFIGENLINKIGIAVLVLGIAFFVKYAIDKDWINEVGRVCIGLGCGAILVGLAHYLRKSYRSFSSVLAGGGIAVFYFTIAFAFHQYHLMPQTAAFIIMVVITAFAVALSVLYNKLELAIIASVGGFVTPFLVSTGEGNYVVLFTYLIILNIGLLSLAWFKRWPVINIISLFFTEIIYGSWLWLAVFDKKVFSQAVALMFASIFYLIFLGMNMIYQVKNRQHFKAIDFFILLLISCSYYTAGMVLLHLWNNGAYQGLFTLAIGLTNLALAWYVHKNGKADRNLLFMLIGLTFSFITLTIPIQLHGHAITMFWSAEFVLLYWLAAYSEIKLFKYSSAIVCLLTLVSLAMDWNKESLHTPGLAIIFSNMQGIITNLVAVAAFTCQFFLLRKYSKDPYVFGIDAIQAAKTMIALSLAILYLTCIFAVNLWFQSLLLYDIPNVYHFLITELFALTILLVIQKYYAKIHPVLVLTPATVCFLFYLCSNMQITGMRNGVLVGLYASSHLYFHWAGSVLFAIIVSLSIRQVRSNNDVFGSSGVPVSIFISIMSIVFLSIDLSHAYIAIGFQKNNMGELATQYGKAGLTALWGICSFSLMWLGMKHKQKALRIISLTLFSIVLLKLFIFDISGISEGGKIFAFILLGVLLLTVSFMYQKLKKIIIDDRKE